MAKRKSHAASTLMGLGALGKAAKGTKTKKPAVKKSVRDTVAAFVAGKRMSKACPVGKHADPSACAAHSSGKELRVHGTVVATRPTAFSKTVKVCPGKMQGAEGRVVANQLLSSLKTGLSIRELEKEAWLGGKGKGNGGVRSGECYDVFVSTAAREKANAAATKAARLDAVRGRSAMRLFDDADAPVVTRDRSGNLFSSRDSTEDAPIITRAERGPILEGLGRKRRKSRRSRR